MHRKTARVIRVAAARTNVGLVVGSLLASLLAVGFSAAPAAAAPEAYVMPSGHLNITVSDLQYIFDQIKMAERHSARTVTSYPYSSSACLSRADVENITSSAFPGVGYTFDVRFPLGLRQVDGLCNNLGAGNATWGAADQVFPRLVPANRIAPYNTLGTVTDAQPRQISNLIADQTAANPAAVEANTLTKGGSETSVNATPGFGSTNVLQVPNITPDGGQSAPYNSWFTLFGQFFDHGLDLVPKGGNGSVVMPLSTDDKYYRSGSPTNFMTLTRATQASGAAAGESINLTTPYVDQNQTYTSHPSHQLFLRGYGCGVVTSTLEATKCGTATVGTAGGRPVATGFLFDSPSTSGVGNGLPTWLDIKTQAANKLGITLTDADVANVPVIFTDQYGRFVPDAVGTSGHALGFPQVVFKDKNNTSVPYTGTYQFRSGSGAAPLALTDFKQGGVTWTPVRTGHAFLDDIAAGAAPNGLPNSPGCASTATVCGLATGQQTAYDGTLLNRHYITGDGRGNENIGLTSVHQVFHEEHNTVATDIKALLATPGASTLNTAWNNCTNTAADCVGQRLFQAARFVTEMEYQHLVFDEFARRFQPGLAPFALYDPTMNAAINAEFAHAVYRFGHSMLTETIARSVVNPSTAVSSAVQSPGLIQGFLSPAKWLESITASTRFDGSAASQADAAAGAVAQGMTSQVGNEVDEFVTEALRNNLVGLPLDLASLNIARARETGSPTLNGMRSYIFGLTGNPALAPYTNWVDFLRSIRYPQSGVNFLAAYATEPSIAAETTTVGRRAAAQTLYNNYLACKGTNTSLPACAFMYGTSGSGVDSIDLWIGGLAERPAKNLLVPAILGSTFDYVFTTQMLRLQNGDRLYYLSRLAGTNLVQQIAGQSFARIIQRNTSASALPSPVFSVPDCTIRATSGAPVVTGGAICATNVSIDPDGTIVYDGQENVVMSARPTVAAKLRGGLQDDTLWGGSGDDALNGYQGSDTIDGGAGNDVIIDSEGADIINGGTGDDIINSGPGVDLVNGGSGQDFMFGGDANGGKVNGGDTGDDFMAGSLAGDLLQGGEGVDWLEGLDSADVLDGDNGATPAAIFLLTGSGDDVIIGGAGTDASTGDAGNDVLIAGNGFDTLNGGPGFDWASYEGAVDLVNADLLRTPILGTADTYQQIEAVSGSAKNDVISGDANQLVNVAGDPALTTARTAIRNLFFGGATLPTYLQQFDSNVLIGGGGNDTMYGERGNDFLDGDAYLHVCLAAPQAVLDAITAVSPTFVANNAVACGAGQGFMSMTILALFMQSRTIKPSDLTIVREIKYDANGRDTVQFAGASTDYSFTRVTGTTNCWVATQIVANGGVQDGTDVFCNFERVQFLGGGGFWYISGSAVTSGTSTNTWNPQNLTGGATLGTFVMPATAVTGPSNITVNGTATSNTNRPGLGSTVVASFGIQDPSVTNPATLVTYTWEVQDSTTAWVTAHGDTPTVTSPLVFAPAVDTQTFTYVPVAADGAFPLRIKATWLDDQGMTRTFVSASTANIVQTQVAAVVDTATFFETTTATRGVSLKTFALAPGAIIDPNGVPKTASGFAYQWATSATLGGTCTNVTGAIYSTYIPELIDVGKFLCVTVTFTDITPHQEVVRVNFPNPVEPGPNNAGRVDGSLLVTAGGPPMIGRQLTVSATARNALTDNDGIAGTPAPTYEWFRSSTLNASGCDTTTLLSSTATYTPTETGTTDLAKYLCVRITYTDSTGLVERPIGVIPTPVYKNTPASLKSLSALFGTDTATVGVPLAANASSGISDADGLPSTFTYAWFRGSSPSVCGATGVGSSTGATASYTPVTADRTAGYLCVRVSFTDGLGVSEVVSAILPVISGPNRSGVLLNTVFSATLREGAPITVNLAALSDSDTLPAAATYNYTWYRTSDSSCATGLTQAQTGSSSGYTPVTDDRNQFLCLRIGYTDLAGYAEAPIVATPAVIGGLWAATNAGSVTATGGTDQFEFTSSTLANGWTYTISGFSRTADKLRFIGFKFATNGTDVSSTGLVRVSQPGGANTSVTITLWQPGPGKNKAPVQVGTITLTNVVGTFSATDATYFLWA